MKVKELLADFQVLGKIGSGSSAQVYLLIHKKEKKFSALKEVFLYEKRDLNSIHNQNLMQELSHINLISYTSLSVSSRPKELKRICKINNPNGLTKETIIKNGITVELSSSPKIIKEKSILNEITPNIKKAPKEKKYYHYLVSNYYDFTLRDYVDLRNNYFYNSNLESCISFSSQPFQCLIPFTDSLGIEKLIPAEFMVHSFAHKNSINKSFINFLVKNVIQGLIYLHSKSIVHNDIKLSNIFIGDKNDFIPKIGDYSDSKVSDDKKEDIYKVGLMWYEMLVPFNTVAERYYCLKKVKESGLPDEFVRSYEKECVIIDLCLKRKKNVGLKRILRLLNKIKD